MAGWWRLLGGQASAWCLCLRPQTSTDTHQHMHPPHPSPCPASGLLAGHTPNPSQARGSSATSAAVPSAASITGVSDAPLHPSSPRLALAEVTWQVVITVKHGTVAIKAGSPPGQAVGASAMLDAALRGNPLFFNVSLPASCPTEYAGTAWQHDTAAAPSSKGLPPGALRPRQSLTGGSTPVSRCCSLHWGSSMRPPPLNVLVQWVPRWKARTSACLGQSPQQLVLSCPTSPPSPCPHPMPPSSFCRADLPVP